LRKLIAFNEILVVFVNLLLWEQNTDQVNGISIGLLVLSIIHVCNLNHFCKLYEIKYWRIKNILYSLFGLILYSLMSNVDLRTFTICVIFLILIQVITRFSLFKYIFEGKKAQKKSWLEKSRYWEKVSWRFRWNYKNLRHRPFRSSSIVLLIVWTFITSFLLDKSQQYDLLAILLIFVLNMLFFLQSSASSDWTYPMSVKSKSIKDRVNLVILQHEWMILRGTFIGTILVCLIEWNNPGTVLEAIKMIVVVGVFFYSFSYLFLELLIKQKRKWE
jgi:hypothetical protein